MMSIKILKLYNIYINVYINIILLIYLFIYYDICSIDLLGLIEEVV